MSILCPVCDADLVNYLLMLGEHKCYQEEKTVNIQVEAEYRESEIKDLLAGIIKRCPITFKVCWHKRDDCKDCKVNEEGK